VHPDLGRTEDSAVESKDEDGDDGAAGALVPGGVIAH